MVFCCFNSECQTDQTDDFGADSVLKNTHFQFLWPAVPKHNQRFTFSVQGSNDVNIVLSETNSPEDDVDDIPGIPKIGMIVFMLLLMML